MQKEACKTNSKFFEHSLTERDIRKNYSIWLIFCHCFNTNTEQHILKKNISSWLFMLTVLSPLEATSLPGSQ